MLRTKNYRQLLGQNYQGIWKLVSMLWKYCWNSPYLRFVNVGFLNIFFILVCGFGINLILSGIVPAFMIALLVSIFHISFSFIMRKVFIYKTKGNWLKEYISCLFSYWSSIIIYVLVLWIFIDSVKMVFWLAQILSFAIATIFYSITSHYFAFIRISKQQEEKLLNPD